VTEFKCVYAPAKRRGIIPRKAAAHKMAAEHDVVKFNRWIKSDSELVTPVLTATPRDQSTTESESVQEIDQTERGITAVTIQKHQSDRELLQLFH